MNYIIISDIHGDADSLYLLQSAIKSIIPHNVICLGDFAGPYNGRIIYDILTINLDASVIAACNNDINGIGHIKTGVQFENDIFAYCHANPINNSDYLLTTLDTFKSFKWMIRNNIKLTFFGHTHSPTIFELAADTGKVESINIVLGKKFPLNKERLYLINPGTLAAMRKHTPYLSYTIYNSEEHSITFHTP